MFQFISKLLPLLVYPLGLSCLLLSVTLVVRRCKKTSAILIVATFLLLWLAGNRFVAMALASSLESRFEPFSIEQNSTGPGWTGPESHSRSIYPAKFSTPSAGAETEQDSFENRHPYDVIVVLGGVMRPQSYPRPMAELNEAGDRLLYAVYLYREGIAPYLLVSGGAALWLGPEQLPEARLMADALSLMGIPKDRIWQEDQSLNTRQNALYSLPILSEKKVQRALLITSALHAPRALSLFQTTDIEVVAAPIDFYVTQDDWAFYTQPNLGIQIFNLLPSAEDLTLTSRVIKEYMGIWINSLTQT